MNMTKLLGRIFRVMVYIFLLCPLATVICTAFSDTNRVVFPPRGFTLEWFKQALRAQSLSNPFLSASRSRQ